ncbi:RDD family protein [Kitasatospora sp. GP82]|uniref:RDD family protein n=1 Tax=Kitasatospora sp. GP82 TaxID=3035089 RepID=UPI00247536B3|nr:RDD family protein [Kitasatospora sp. GP82]MDH6126662.1 putative RDD family membrane protein YckC [Kitasatospora sp. GP82]
MSNQNPSGPEPEGGGKPSSDKQQPPAAGTPSDPYGTPPPPPPAAGPYGAPPPQPPQGGPYDTPGSYGAQYGAPPPGYGSPYPPGPGAEPGTGAVPGMPPLGSWPNRIAAKLIDYIGIQIIAAAIVLLFSNLSEQNGFVGATWLGYAMYLVYEGLMLSRDGQTVGKKLMKVRVAMLSDGSSPTGAAAWIRSAVFVAPALLCCGLLWWPVDGLFGVFDKPYRQCIHDKAARTVVVSTA